MALRLVVTVSALFLLKVESQPNITTTTQANDNSPLDLGSRNGTDCPCPCSSPAPTVPASTTRTPGPSLAVLTVKWEKSCRGDVLVKLLPSPEPPLHLCHDDSGNVEGLLSEVCERAKGCQGKPHGWAEDEEMVMGFKLATGRGESCKAMKVRCKVLKEPPASEQQGSGGYKVATVLLCLVLVALLLIRFTKPTVKALQKRLSDRRQSRWIGPTQSQSVSYHRGKAAAQNNDGDKRLSYPALERLTVSNSREPSSNRNSDYNY